MRKGGKEMFADTRHQPLTQSKAVPVAKCKRSCCWTPYDVCAKQTFCKCHEDLNDMPLEGADDDSAYA